MRYIDLNDIDCSGIDNFKGIKDVEYRIIMLGYVNRCVYKCGFVERVKVCRFIV